MQLLVNRQRDKIMEMAAVMMKSVDLDEKDSLRQHELLVQLKAENDGLRQLLAISRSNGSITTAKKKDPEPVLESEQESGTTATMIPKKKASSSSSTTSTATQTEDTVDPA